MTLYASDIIDTLEQEKSEIIDLMECVDGWTLSKAGHGLDICDRWHQQHNI